MFTVTREIGIDAGHRVPFHGSQCRRLHGHRYTVRATAEAIATIDYEAANPASAMLVDFGDLKAAMMAAVHHRYDHMLILWEQDPMLRTLMMAAEQFSASPPLEEFGIILVPCIPTAEELAKLWFHGIDQVLRENVPADQRARGLKLSSVQVYETPNNVASYNPKFDGRKIDGTGGCTP